MEKVDRAFRVKNGEVRTWLAKNKARKSTCLRRRADPEITRYVNVRFVHGWRADPVLRPVPTRQRREAARDLERRTASRAQIK